VNIRFNLKQFREKYGTHDLCLDSLKELRYPSETICPKCKEPSAFYRVSNRSAYACKLCGWHVYPLAGTIFEKTSTPLDLWFYAMFLMIHTRSGTSAKQLERMLGVTYKTAWRIFKQIRMLMAQLDTTMLEGIVEVDETFIGGKGKNRMSQWHGNEKPKEVVMGMIKRNEKEKGGDKAYIKHIPNTGKWTLLKQVKDHVDTTARIITDENPGYIQLKYHNYLHDFVKHKETFVIGDIYTQNVEAFWSILKRGVYGVYRKVSKKYLQAYIDEYAWRYNHRKQSGKMFELLLQQVLEVKVLKASQLSSAT